MNKNLYDAIGDHKGKITKINLKRIEYPLVLTMGTSLSHNDPSLSNESNKSLFRRQKKILSTKGNMGNNISQEDINAILARIPVPVSIAPLLQELRFSQFLACAIFKLFIDIYNSKEGEGLFSGLARYKYLEERFNHAAVMSNSLLDMWGKASNALGVSPPFKKYQSRLLTLLMLPSVLSSSVLSEISDNPRSCLTIARIWHDETKKIAINNDESIDNILKSRDDHVSLNYNVSSISSLSHGVVSIPVFSTNSIRHEMVREPGLWHLFDKLSLSFDEVHPVITAMFYNGGDLAKGAKAPSDAFWIAKGMKENYPLLGLIGGTTDAFIIGESNLRIHSWIICKENNDETVRYGVESSISIFDMLDDYHLYRHALRIDGKPMPYSFEVIAPGVKILTLFSLTPYANNVQIGALMSALECFKNNDSTLGGRSARGFGFVSDILTTNGHIFDFKTDEYRMYNSYLEENAEKLREGLTSGTFLTGKKIITG